MLQFSDIHLEDLKHLSLPSFTQLLINDIYPFFYTTLNKLEDEINLIKEDYDIEILESTQQKIYSEFDQLYRKEKLVLFPYLIKLDAENKKSDNCAPFKNIRIHYTSMLSHVQKAKELVSHLFINSDNNLSIDRIDQLLMELSEQIIQIQQIKEKYLFSPVKNCSACASDKL